MRDKDYPVQNVEFNENDFSQDDNEPLNQNINLNNSSQDKISDFGLDEDFGFEMNNSKGKLPDFNIGDNFGKDKSRNNQDELPDFDIEDDFGEVFQINNSKNNQDELPDFDIEDDFEQGFKNNNSNDSFLDDKNFLDGL